MAGFYNTFGEVKIGTSPEAFWSALTSYDVYISFVAQYLLIKSVNAMLLMDKDAG